MARFRDQRKGPYEGDVLGMAKHIAQELRAALTEPGSNWPMMLFYLDSHGQGHAATILLESKTQRDLRIQLTLNQAKATEAVLMTNSWSAQLPPGAEIVPASEVPSRREVLHLAHVDKESVTFHEAEIHRRPDQPPTLGEFHELTGDFQDGRLTDALRRGISG